MAVRSARPLIKSVGDLRILLSIEPPADDEITTVSAAALLSVFRLPYLSKAARRAIPVNGLPSNCGDESSKLKLPNWAGVTSIWPVVLMIDPAAPFRTVGTTLNNVCEALPLPETTWIELKIGVVPLGDGPPPI